MYKMRDHLLTVVKTSIHSREVFGMQVEGGHEDVRMKGHKEASDNQPITKWGELTTWVWVIQKGPHLGMGGPTQSTCGCSRQRTVTLYDWWVMCVASSKCGKPVVVFGDPGGSKCCLVIVCKLKVLTPGILPLY